MPSELVGILIYRCSQQRHFRQGHIYRRRFFSANGTISVPGFPISSGTMPRWFCCIRASVIEPDMQIVVYLYNFVHIKTQ